MAVQDPPISANGHVLPVVYGKNAAGDYFELQLTDDGSRLKVDLGAGTVTITGDAVLDNAPILAALDLLAAPTKFRAVTPSDSTDVTTYATKGLYVTADGDVVVKGTGDSAAVTLAGMTAGKFIPGAFKRVMLATTATVVACS